MVADHGVQENALVKSPWGAGDEVREGQLVECGETGELVLFRPTLKSPNSLVSPHLILTCRHAQGAQVLE